MRSLVSMRMARWAAVGVLLAAGIAGCGASSSRSSGGAPTTATPAVATPTTPAPSTGAIPGCSGGGAPCPATSSTIDGGSQQSAVQQQRQAACDQTGTVEDCGAYNLTPGPASPYFGSQPDAFGNYSVRQGPGASGADDTPSDGNGG
jgi:hypothetical protein